MPVKCERCSTAYVDLVLVAKELTNSHTEVTCVGCFDPEIDKLWASVNQFPGRELSMLNKTRLRIFRRDLKNHEKRRAELGDSKD